MAQDRRPTVYIVIINWKRLNDILGCLDSVFKLDYKGFRVVIVDNGSDDGSCELILKKFPTVHLIRNNCNLGYTGANNVGIRFAMEQGGDYIWLLNNDTVVDRGSLRNLVELAEENELIGLVSPIIYYYDKPQIAQFSGSYMDWKNLSLTSSNEENQPAEKNLQDPDQICLWGTALLIKRKVIEKIGYLNEKYFAYYEDTEYSLRSLRAGFKNHICRSSRVFHKNQTGDQDGEKKGKYFYYYMHRNRFLLINEYLRTPAERIKMRIKFLAGISDYMNRCKNDYRDACLDGAWQGFKGITGEINEKIKMPIILKRFLIFISRFHPVFLFDLIFLDIKEASRKILKEISSGYC